VNIIYTFEKSKGDTFQISTSRDVYVLDLTYRNRKAQELIEKITEQELIYPKSMVDNGVLSSRDLLYLRPGEMNPISEILFNSNNYKSFLECNTFQFTPSEKDFYMMTARNQDLLVVARLVNNRNLQIHAYVDHKERDYQFNLVDVSGYILQAYKPELLGAHNLSVYSTPYKTLKNGEELIADCVLVNFQPYKYYE